MNFYAFHPKGWRAFAFLRFSKICAEKSTKFVLFHSDKYGRALRLHQGKLDLLT